MTNGITQTIGHLMAEHYDLGRPTRVKEILGGYCNKSYAVWMTRNGEPRRYFLRLYNPDIVKNEIIFEHALINHLRSNGFELAAAIIPCRNKGTLVTTPPPEDHPGEQALWALFEFLEGENTYSWTNTDLSNKAFISAADILARLHHCGFGFIKPPGTDRGQPRIMNFIPAFKETFSGFLRQTEERQCDRLFRKNFNPICRTIDTAVSHTARFRGMPEMPIHCDYHPGNLKYRDEEGVGIFDFDWSKIDYRLFDLALGLYYFTGIWGGKKCGLRRDKFELFLNTYNNACRAHTHIGPLSIQETQNLVPMLSIASLYVLNWDLVDFYSTLQPEDGEYIVYFEHDIGLMHWIARNTATLEQWVDRSLK